MWGDGLRSVAHHSVLRVESVHAVSVDARTARLAPVLLLPLLHQRALSLLPHGRDLLLNLSVDAFAVTHSDAVLPSSSLDLAPMCTVHSFNAHCMNTKKKLSLNALIDHVEADIGPLAVNGWVTAGNEVLEFLHRPLLPFYPVPSAFSLHA